MTEKPINNRDDEDVLWMKRALALAQNGRGRVEPNPPVGAVIVRDGKLLSEGWHEQFGGAHAEIVAIQNAGGECRGATLYVTLEPCTGMDKKTPPCCDSVVKAGLSRIVIGAKDDTQEPAVPRLLAAGIQVTVPVLEEESRRLIAPFLKLHLQKMPYIIAKWAMTADGRIATSSGESRWISSEPSRDLVHQWRNQVDAVLVGIGTVLRDDPLLTCRISGGRNPLRIVLDADAMTPLESKLVASSRQAPLLIVCSPKTSKERRNRLESAGCRTLSIATEAGKIDTAAFFLELGNQNLTNVLVEGGGTVLGDLFDRRLADEARIFIAPKIFGGIGAPSPVGGKGFSSPLASAALAQTTWQQVGSDMLLTGLVQYPQPAP